MNDIHIICVNFVLLLWPRLPSVEQTRLIVVDNRNKTNIRVKSQFVGKQKSAFAIPLQG
jgi:hypothetical protein